MIGNLISRSKTICNFFFFFFILGFEEEVLKANDTTQKAIGHQPITE